MAMAQQVNLISTFLFANERRERERERKREREKRERKVNALLRKG